MRPLPLWLLSGGLACKAGEAALEVVSGGRNLSDRGDIQRAPWWGRLAGCPPSSGRARGPVRVGSESQGQPLRGGHASYLLISAFASYLEGGPEMGLSGSRERWASSQRSPGVRTRTANRRARVRCAWTSPTHSDQAQKHWTGSGHLSRGFPEHPGVPLEPELCLCSQPQGTAVA